LILKLAVSGLLIAVGAGASFSDVLYLWRRPGLLVRSLLAMYVLVPLAAVGLANAIPLSPGVELVFLVIAVSAGAPLIPRRLRFEAGTYLVSLVITSSIISSMAGDAIAHARDLRGFSIPLCCDCHD